MSYSNFIKAMELAKKCKYFFSENGRSEDEINRAEDMLGIKFSKECLEFYLHYGYLSFVGNEIFGIYPDDMTGEPEGNSLAYALEERINNGLSPNWVPIYNYNDGNMAYLDYSNLNESMEPRVIEAFYDGKNYVTVGVEAEDFGDFILRLVEEDDE